MKLGSPIVLMLITLGIPSEITIICDGMFSDIILISLGMSLSIENLINDGIFIGSNFMIAGIS